MLSVLASCLIALAYSSSYPPTAAQSHALAESHLEGVWTGEFLQTEWTFEFTKRDGNWSGRYMTSKGAKWHPINDLVITDRAASFTLELKPKVSFDLDFDPSKQELAGEVTVEGVASAPFVATRKP